MVNMYGKATCYSLRVLLFLTVGMAAIESICSEITQSHVSTQQEIVIVEKKSSQPNDDVVNSQLMSTMDSKIADIDKYVKQQVVGFDNKFITMESDLYVLKADLQRGKAEQQAMQIELQKAKAEQQATQIELQMAKAEQQVTEVELNNTKIYLQAIKDDLEITKLNQVTTMKELQTRKVNLLNTKIELQRAREECQVTKNQVQNTTADLKMTKDQLQTTKTDLQNTKADLRDAKAGLQNTEAEVQMLKSTPGGSSFVRWGRKDCPGNTSLVYSGLAGGKDYWEKGSGTNRLCLTREPEFDNNTDSSAGGYLSGAQYRIPGHIFHDVPCSVCLAAQSTTIMVPGAWTCPPTWTPQYRGHLASERHLHFAAEYVCLDEEPQSEDNLATFERGNLFYYTKTKCGSLLCPPYEDEKIATCVVCSK